MELPDVLAGPILRRAEPGRVCIWLATSAAHAVGADVFALRPGGHRRVGGGEARSVRLGPHLHVHLVTARPDGEHFPTDELLGYDLRVAGDGWSSRLADLGLVSGRRSIVYPGLPLPTFFLRGRSAPSLHLLHGSCRLLHGKGEDAFPAADEVLARTVHDLTERPSAFFLTGDQIYGDDVAGPLIGHLTRMGAALLGQDDDVSVPGVPPLSTIPLYGRQQLVASQACFTSEKGSNHLLSLGEFAAAYLVAWDEDNWPTSFAPAQEAVPDHRAGGLELARLRHKYQSEARCLQAARRALPAVRRVLANVPVYMVFDDHDVTDDWNITAEWKGKVEGSATGRRVVANALGAYWAFQGWGNEPNEFDDDFVGAVSGGPEAGSKRDDSFDHAMLSFDRWSYRAPTEPPTVVLDTRTQRSYDSHRGAARLVGPDELDRVKYLVREEGVTPPGPVILVSPVPVFGLELQERRQKFLDGKLGPYEIDFEEWHSNLHGLTDLMRCLVEDLGLARCVMLSGDIHYGLSVDATFTVGDAELRMAQLVSSSFKHSGAVAKHALHLLGRLVRRRHHRIGWQHAPSCEGSTNLARRLLRRPVNTDEWGDAPVFLSPRLAGWLKVDEDPDYEEVRRYAPPEERPSMLIVGEANVGLVSLHDDRVVHRLIGRTGPTENVTYTSTIRL
ncbi:MAG: alkaline phosphatase D family protein [Actinomycetota bacterium]|nr:alkaline phosphatase D family protein [Actinomycetota bacterium]